jgi:hypothetical protein
MLQEKINFYLRSMKKVGLYSPLEMSIQLSTTPINSIMKNKAMCKIINKKMVKSIPRPIPCLAETKINMTKKNKYFITFKKLFNIMNPVAIYLNVINFYENVNNINKELLWLI